MPSLMRVSLGMCACSRGLSEQQLTAEQQAVQVQQQQLLAAWQQQAILQQQWHVKQLAAATKLYSRRLLWKALSIWRREYCVQQAVTAKATARSRFLLLQRILQVSTAESSSSHCSSQHSHVIRMRST